MQLVLEIEKYVVIYESDDDEEDGFNQEPSFGDWFMWAIHSLANFSYSREDSLSTAISNQWFSFVLFQVIWATQV